MKEHTLTVNQVGQNDTLGKRVRYGGTCSCGWLSLAVWDSTTLLQRAYEAHLRNKKQEGRS